VTEKWFFFWLAQATEKDYIAADAAACHKYSRSICGPSQVEDLTRSESRQLSGCASGQRLLPNVADLIVN
jgi:hypothetical protein